MLIKTNPSPDSSRRSSWAPPAASPSPAPPWRSSPAIPASPQRPTGNPASDVGILNVALGLEHEAIAADQVGAESGLLQKPVLDLAVLFQSHHKGHRDALWWPPSRRWAAKP